MPPRPSSRINVKSPNTPSQLGRSELPGPCPATARERRIGSIPDAGVATLGSRFRSWPSTVRDSGTFLSSDRSNTCFIQHRAANNFSFASLEHTPRRDLVVPQTAIRPQNVVLCRGGKCVASGHRSAPQRAGLPTCDLRSKLGDFTGTVEQRDDPRKSARCTAVVRPGSRCQSRRGLNVLAPFTGYHVDPFKTTSLPETLSQFRDE